MGRCRQQRAFFFKLLKEIGVRYCTLVHSVVPRLGLPGLMRYALRYNSAISIDRLVLLRAPKKSRSESDTCERPLLWQVVLQWHRVD